MQKRNKKLTILDIEKLNLFLDDFDAIFMEKNKELGIVLKEKTLYSIKMPKINSLLFKVLSYRDCFKEIKTDFDNFKESVNFDLLSVTDKLLIDSFENKINKNLRRSNNFIKKCDGSLQPIENDCKIN